MADHSVGRYRSRVIITLAMLSMQFELQGNIFLYFLMFHTSRGMKSTIWLDALGTVGPIREVNLSTFLGVSWGVDDCSLWSPVGPCPIGPCPIHRKMREVQLAAGGRQVAPTFPLSVPIQTLPIQTLPIQTLPIQTLPEWGEWGVGPITPKTPPSSPSRIGFIFIGF